MKFLELFKDAKKGFYRYFFFLQGKESLNRAMEVLDEYLGFNESATVAYAFHPWVEGSKERLKEFKKLYGELVDIDYSSSERYLGSTFDVVVLDAVDDFRPNYVARLSDMARGGGIVLLYSDDIKVNKLYKSSLTRRGVVKDLFEERFIRLAKTRRGVVYVDDNEERVNSFSSAETSLPKKRGGFNVPKRLYELCLTDDQAKVLEEFDFVEEGGKRVFSVVAPRGRGKSFAVGLALSWFMVKKQDEGTSIVLTSPSYYSSSEVINAVLRGAKAFNVKVKLNESREGKIMSLRIGNSRIRWLAPDLAKDEDGDLIVIDEAAALGIENLDLIMRRWEKVVLVTTVHGYEGSGKSFLKYVNNLKVPSQMVKLSFPIRFAKGDPVEKLMYDAFLLDAEPEDMNVSDGVREITQEEMFSNEELLRQVYSILVSAHYRNSPDDLMVLGDLAFQRVFVELPGIAVGQVVEEGGLDEEEITAIMHSEGNEGNLIPHRIIKYMRAANFGKLKGWRVMRIAVVPGLQGQGHGSALLRKIEEEGARAGIDWIGSSFVAEVKVLGFWLKNGYTPVYLASRKNEGLGGYSVIVMKGISKEGKRLESSLSILLKEKILRTSHQVYFNVNPLALIKILMATPSLGIGDLAEIHRAKILAYLNGEIAFNTASESIHLLAEKYFYEKPINVDEVSLASLFSRSFQGKSWYHAGIYLGLKPREVEEKAKEAISKILSYYYPETEDKVNL
ncbi:MAG: GNAT family N-acetyltransferase [Candidatus Aramenus sp.]|nr:GNAT family N-acetyltransferase [Candidatus Aramenus sp.]